jgi:hypothetical protein
MSVSLKRTIRYKQSASVLTHRVGFIKEADIVDCETVL